VVEELGEAGRKDDFSPGEALEDRRVAGAEALLRAGAGAEEGEVAAIAVGDFGEGGLRRDHGGEGRGDAPRVGGLEADCTGSEQALGLRSVACPAFVQAGQYCGVQHRGRRARRVLERRAGVEEDPALEPEGAAGIAHRGPLGTDGGHALERALVRLALGSGFDARIYTSQGDSP
jgi:hypothetical protein